MCTLLRMYDMCNVRCTVQKCTSANVYVGNKSLKLICNKMFKIIKYMRSRREQTSLKQIL